MRHLFTKGKYKDQIKYFFLDGRLQHYPHRQLWSRLWRCYALQLQEEYREFLRILKTANRGCEWFSESV